MTIDCCKKCVPPKRHPKCHADCPEYQEQRKALDEENKRIQEQQSAEALGFITETQIKKKEKWIRGWK